MVSNWVLIFFKSMQFSSPLSKVHVNWGNQYTYVKTSHQNRIAVSTQTVINASFFFPSHNIAKYCLSFVKNYTTIQRRKTKKEETVKEEDETGGGK